MNLNKHLEFFDPTALTDEIHIIGCGAVGSTIAEQLARLGIKKLHLYDFDKVSEHNITNQMYWHKHIGMQKLTALSEILTNINPDIELILHEKGWKEHHTLSGYVFIAVDNIDTRKEIIHTNRYNTNIKAAFDIRIRLTDAQHFAAHWNPQEIEFLLSTMDFTREEAQASTPVSACGTTLSVTPTVRHICASAVANLINVITNKHKLTKTLLIDTFAQTIDAFNEDGQIE
jgi:molybdopterin/thiamine biosynthesis adenylyltransferase